VERTNKDEEREGVVSIVHSEQSTLQEMKYKKEAEFIKQRQDRLTNPFFHKYQPTETIPPYHYKPYQDDPPIVRFLFELIKKLMILLRWGMMRNVDVMLLSVCERAVQIEMGLFPS
jgi:hypothetical protein